MYKDYLLSYFIQVFISGKLVTYVIVNSINDVWKIDYLFGGYDDRKTRSNYAVH